MKKILISNVTGSQKEVATLHVTSGIVEFKDGSISHLLFEKQMQKTIVEYHEPAKEEVKPKADESSVEQSNAGVKKKIKQK